MRKIIIIVLFIFFTNSYVCDNSPYFYKEYKTPSVKEIICIKVKEYKLSLPLVLAIIKLESNFNPTEKNKYSTAYGLPQFLKSTGEWVYKELGYTNYNHYNTSVSVQIEMMCWYLNYLKEKYNNNEEKMLKEYSGNTKNYYKVVMKLKSKYKEEIKNDSIKI